MCNEAMKLIGNVNNFFSPTEQHIAHKEISSNNLNLESSDAEIVESDDEERVEKRDSNYVP